jgi:hypothetical protein
MGMGLTKSGRVEKITTIPRGADLTDDDLRTIVEDFYLVRNWAALQMRMGVPELKRQLFEALQVRLGRREQVGPVEPVDD